MIDSTTVSCRLDAIQWPAALADLRLRFRAANARFVERWKTLGGDPDLLSGGSLAALCRPEDQLKIRHELWRRSTGVAVTHSLRLADPPSVLELTPLESEDGPAGWLVTLHDVDRLAEPPVNRLRVAALVHDLKMPVQAVLGWVALMRKKPMAGKQLDKALDIIERNVLLEAAMLSDLQAVTQLTDLAPERRVTQVDIAYLARSTVEALRPLAEEAGVELRASAPLVPVVVPGDTQDMTRILSNLIVNAIKYSDRRGSIECRVVQQDRCVRLTVHDEGRGIAAGFLPHVFESFRREHRTDGPVEGAGLGLAVVRQLVQRHGGDVRAESAGPGCGSTFTVTLPTEPRDFAGQWPGAAAC